MMYMFYYCPNNKDYYMQYILLMKYKFYIHLFDMLYNQFHLYKHLLHKFSKLQLQCKSNMYICIKNIDYWTNNNRSYMNYILCHLNMYNIHLDTININYYYPNIQSELYKINKYLNFNKINNQHCILNIIHSLNKIQYNIKHINQINN